MGTPHTVWKAVGGTISLGLSNINVEQCRWACRAHVRPVSDGDDSDSNADHASGALTMAVSFGGSAAGFIDPNTVDVTVSIVLSSSGQKLTGTAVLQSLQEDANYNTKNALGVSGQLIMKNDWAMVAGP